MDPWEEKSVDLYAVLGLSKECSNRELRSAYKKLALRWHPDRYCASGNSKFVDEAKTKFQAIQQAYSVLSDSDKRFLYDVGIYDSDEDQEGMCDFFSEMAAMMNQNKPKENAQESFEELQDLFMDMFQAEMHNSAVDDASGDLRSFSSFSSSSSGCSEVGARGLKRDSSDMIFGRASSSSSSTEFSDLLDSVGLSFCVGASHMIPSDSASSTSRKGSGGGKGRRGGRMQ